MAQIELQLMTRVWRPEFTFREKDDEAHEATIDASGRDARGAGTASAAITAKMREEGGRTTVMVDTDLKITGKLAQFGRGMIQEVSSKLLGQFVDCLQGKLAEGEGEGTEPAADTAGGSAPAPEAPSSGTSPAPAATAAAEPAAPAEAAATPTADATAPAEPAASATGQAEQPQTASATRTDTGTDAEEPAALDLMSVAGSSIYKRLVPLIIVVAVIVVAVIIYLVVT